VCVCVCVCVCACVCACVCVRVGSYATNTMIMPRVKLNKIFPSVAKKYTGLNLNDIMKNPMIVVEGQNIITYFDLVWPDPLILTRANHMFFSYSIQGKSLTNVIHLSWKIDNNSLDRDGMPLSRVNVDTQDITLVGVDTRQIKTSDLTGVGELGLYHAANPFLRHMNIKIDRTNTCEEFEMKVNTSLREGKLIDLR